MSELPQLLEFFKTVEALKDTLRTGFTQQGRQESVAEHSWRLALMAIIIGPKYFPELDFKKVMTMCIIHDVGEIINGDIPAPDQVNYPDKSEQERKDFKEVIQSLPQDISDNLLHAWDEYESAETKEARLVKALDKIETIIQHNQGMNPSEIDHNFNLDYGKKYMNFDPIIERMRALVDEDTAAMIGQIQHYSSILDV